MSASEELFVTGDIYLLQYPVNGNYGLNRINSMLYSGELGIEYEPGTEIWVVYFNRKRTRLYAFHADLYGYSQIRRRLNHGRFLFELATSGKVQITRRELRRLCLDGTLSGPYKNAALDPAKAS